MDLKKLFKRNKTPDIVGKDASKLDIPTEVVNKIYLQFIELEGEPIYELKDKLTIGSEAGDIIFDEPSLAAKHCTFTHAQDVISLMDHGSSEGTFINKKRISPGRIFILQEKDKIRIGDLLIKLSIQEEEIPIEEEIASFDDDEQIDPEVIQRMQKLASGQIPELPKPSKNEVTADSVDDMPEVPDLELKSEPPSGPPNTEDLVLDDDADITSAGLDVLEEDIEEDDDEPFDLDDEELDEKTRKILRATGAKKLKVKASASVVESSNTLVRVFALIVEIIIILFALTFLTSLKDFQEAVKLYPEKIWTMVKGLFNDFAKIHYDTYLKVHVDKLLKDVPAIGKGFEELLGFLEKHPQVLCALYIYIVIRVITPFIFGVSIGQAMIGIRALGNTFVKRITGVLREIVGFFTFAFVIFDLPALFSKRTFKEIITFSHIETKSTGKTIFLTFLWLFLFTLLYIAKPLIDSGELPVAIPVEVMTLKPTKIQLANDIISHDLKIKGKLPESYIVLPEFSVIHNQKKRSFHSNYKILNVEDGEYIKVARVKSIFLPALFSKALSGNYLANWKYPEIQKITHDVSRDNKNFKVEDHLDIEKISHEISFLLKGSFSLTLEEIHHHILVHGPFLKGYLDFKKSLLSQVDENVESIGMDFIGATPFIIFNLKDKKKQIALSIGNRNADLYLFEASKNIKKTAMLFDNIGFSQSLGDEQSALNMFVIVDKLMQFPKITAEEFQDIYQFLYNKSKSIMITKDEFLIKQLTISIESIIQFSEALENVNKDKFFQNISDMLQAIKDEDMSYFGISKIKTARVIYE